MRNRPKIIDNNPQKLLFDISSDAALIQKLLSIPKIDLHRHLTGSISTKTAVKIAAKYGIKLPTYIVSKLQNILYDSRGIDTLREYFSPWPILNRLFISKEATHDILLEIVKEAAQDNIIYMELRMGPQHFLGQGPFSFTEFVETVSRSLTEADAAFGITTRCILGIPRHVFGNIPFQIRNKMFARIISIISAFIPHCFVGVDLNGDETAFDASEFRVFFKLAREKGLNITVHAGECGPASNVKYAVDQLTAKRIGHGIAAANDKTSLQILAKNNCALEICPTSNEILGLVSQTAELPLTILQENDVPFVICSDNPARCNTTLSEELFKVTKAFNFSFSRIKDIVYSSLKYSFADEGVKKTLKAKMKCVVDILMNPE